MAAALTLLIVALVLVAAYPAVADKWFLSETGIDRPFDRDRSHARRDAYRAVDRTATQFIRGCGDELALREARRLYSTLGPLGERR